MCFCYVNMSLSSMATSVTFNNQVCHTETVEVILYGDSRGVGITVEEGGFSTGFGDPPIITSVHSSSPAEKCGLVKEGDRILKINGKDISDKMLDDINIILHECRRRCDLNQLWPHRLPAHGGGLGIGISDDSCEDSVTYTVELKRHGGPLGITISGTDIHTDPIIISDIIEGGLADRTGAIHIGDKLLGINSESMKGRNLTEATNLLKNAGDIVTLKIARPSETSSEEETTTPGASGDSALESWDSYGQDVIIDASGHTHPIVVGKPVMKKKISTSGYQSQDSKTRTSESTGNHSDDSDCEWGNSSSDGESCHSNNISSEDAAEWTRAFQVYENQSDLLQQIGTSLRQRSTASLDRNVKRKTASLDRRSRPSDDRRRQKYKNIAHSTARSALSEEELSNVHKPKKIPPEKGLKPSFKENVLTLYCPTPIQVQKIKLTRNSLDEGFGFGLSDGMYEKGVYVSGVKKDSIADKCGLKQFDRLLQVNGKRTRDFDCHLALPLISDSKLQLNLIVCRKPKPEIKTAKPKLDNKKNKKTTENQAVKEHNSLDEKVLYTNIQVIKGDQTPKSFYSLHLLSPLIDI
ncbi:hypothetical protein KUTeg_017485 [Tegillarca granosa]|uniref:PDZ domain-containing protein n=1 Tax=Tegillarca granosa TaxID=220873 RepID=A0ABQ9EIY7_TEGGR|nr:hypothetical protein KUTeg_017485 [Tegillarca granosa]